MNKTPKTITPFAALVLCLALGNGRMSANPEDDQSTPRSDSQTQTRTDSQSQTRTDSRTQKQVATKMGDVPKCHKASGLIGMNVRNEKDERLGEIKDLVLDVESERIAYAVMSTGAILPGKLLAVPLNAFTPSDDRKHLILRADKSKVEAAAGFDRDHWPDPSNPSWAAEPFWEKQSLKSGTPGNYNTSDTPGKYNHNPSDTPGKYNKDRNRNLNENQPGNTQPKPDQSDNPQPKPDNN